VAELVEAGIWASTPSQIHAVERKTVIDGSGSLFAKGKGGRAHPTQPQYDDATAGQAVMRRSAKTDGSSGDFFFFSQKVLVHEPAFAAVGWSTAPTPELSIVAQLPPA